MFFYHFCLLCACVNEPVLVIPSMLQNDIIGTSEHARTTIIWYYRACSQLQKAMGCEPINHYPEMADESMLGIKYIGCYKYLLC